jgi:acyl-CoA reductase-like NAD-dependent aldehyde dehydrogenase
VPVPGEPSSHQGQICLTAGRHLIHERVAGAYVEALVRKAESLVVGDPFDERVQVGPIVNERQAANVDRIDPGRSGDPGGLELVEGGDTRTQPEIR